ncbi:MAG: cysteine desulfurase family protein, partial [Planctomycetota bacterium]
MSLPYFDYNAMTPLDPRCRAAMEPYWDEVFANPASTHPAGRRAREAVEAARETIRAVVGGTETDLLVLTSGATEANNLAILGCAAANAYRGRHVICSAIEHSSVLEPVKRLGKCGFDVETLPVKSEGAIDPHQLKSAIRADTTLVSVMAANNETGVEQDVAACAEICERKDVAFHTDATQIIGKAVYGPVGDLVSFSSHKTYGPNGVGALLIRRSRRPMHLKPITFGGGHEHGLRPGTVPVPLVVGFSQACELANSGLEEERQRLAGLRDHFEAKLRTQLPGVIQFNGQAARRLPHVSNFSLHIANSDRVIEAIQDRIAVSPAAACHGLADKPSHVLTAMGLPDQMALATIRWSIGRHTTIDEVNHAVEDVTECVNQLVKRKQATAHDRKRRK